MGRPQGPSRPTPPIVWFIAGIALIAISAVGIAVESNQPDNDLSFRAFSYFFLFGPIGGAVSLIAGVVALFRRRRSRQAGDDRRPSTRIDSP
jgi:hypothetical protein